MTKPNNKPAKSQSQPPKPPAKERAKKVASATRQPYLLSEAEWALLKKERTFRKEDEDAAREEIDAQLTLYGFHILRNSDVPELIQRLQSTIKAFKSLQQCLRQMAPLTHSKFHQFDSETWVVKGPNKAMLPGDKFDELEKVMDGALNDFERRFRDLQTGGQGPDTADAYVLVRELNKIVQARSDGGPLIRSAKSLAKGNDLQFVKRFFEIVDVKFNQQFGLGTAENSIRDLKIQR